MNLIDAIKSGKPYRRKAWVSHAHHCFQIKGGRFWFTEMMAEPISEQDILGEDYEIQEPSVTITRKQFFEAADACIEYVGCKDSYACVNMVKMATILGLDPA